MRYKTTKKNKVHDTQVVDNLVAEQLKDKLSKEIKMRFGLGGYETKDGATYPWYLRFVDALVDPRFKELPFLSDEQKESLADFRKYLRAWVV